MQICEIESCDGKKINTLDLLYYDEKNYIVKKLNGDVVVGFDRGLKQIGQDINTLEKMIRDLHCDSINDEVLEELSKFRLLLKKYEEDISEIAKQNIEIQRKIYDEIKKSLANFKAEYEVYVKVSEEKITKQLKENFEEIQNKINDFKEYVDAQNKKVNDNIADNLDDLYATKNKLSVALTKQSDEIQDKIDTQASGIYTKIDKQANGIYSKLDNQVKEVSGKLEEANKSLTDLATADEMESVGNKIDKSAKDIEDINIKINNLYKKTQTADKNIYAEIVDARKDLDVEIDREIKVQIKDKLARVNNQSLLNGGNLSTGKNLYIDVTGRGNFTEARAIAIGRNGVHSGDFVVLRWRNNYRVRSGYNYRWVNRTYVKKYVIRGNSWISV